MAWGDDTRSVPPTLLKETHLMTNSPPDHVCGGVWEPKCAKEPNSEFANSDCDSGKFLFSSSFNQCSTSLLISL